MKNESKIVEGDLLVGANAIGKFLGLTNRQVYRLVYDQLAPSFKLGGSIAARKTRLRDWMDDIDKD